MRSAVKRFVLWVGCMSIFLTGCANSETNAIYLIPEAYTGYAIAVYNVKNAPPLTYEKGFAVHTMNEDGYFATSQPDMQYGTVTDQYFYVDQGGNRTPIDPTCIHTFGTGGLQSDKVNLLYTGIEVTDNCSEAFAHSSENFDDAELRMIMNKVTKQYYDVEAYP